MKKHKVRSIKLYQQTKKLKKLLAMIYIQDDYIEVKHFQGDLLAEMETSEIPFVMRLPKDLSKKYLKLQSES